MKRVNPAELMNRIFSITSKFATRDYVDLRTTPVKVRYYLGSNPAPRKVVGFSSKFIYIHFGKGSVPASDRMLDFPSLTLRSVLQDFYVSSAKVDYQHDSTHTIRMSIYLTHLPRGERHEQRPNYGEHKRTL